MSSYNEFNYDYKRNISPAKQKLREQIKKQIEEFEKLGGKIEQIQSGISAQTVKVKDGRYVE